MDVFLKSIFLSTSPSVFPLFLYKKIIIFKIHFKFIKVKAFDNQKKNHVFINSALHLSSISWWTSEPAGLFDRSHNPQPQSD